jgi:hypothetical protein
MELKIEISRYELPKFWGEASANFQGIVAKTISGTLNLLFGPICLPFKKR